MFLNKVVLGKVYSVTAFAQVRACPAGFNSVSSSALVATEFHLELFVGCFQ
jgi:hypothetical protein